MGNLDIRWIQRFENFSRALEALQRALTIEVPTEVERGGIIQFFEFSFELGWKTLKDYLNDQSVEVKFPREVLKSSFSYNLIEDGDIWMDMLDKRNLMTHTYDEKNAILALELIRNQYFPQLILLQNKLSGLLS